MRQFTIDINGTVFSSFNGKTEEIGTYRAETEELNLFVNSRNQYRITFTLTELEQLSREIRAHSNLMDNLFKLF